MGAKTTRTIKVELDNGAAAQQRARYVDRGGTTPLIGWEAQAFVGNHWCRIHTDLVEEVESRLGPGSGLGPMAIVLDECNATTENQG